jgi:hypothetical protein
MPSPDTARPEDLSLTELRVLVGVLIGDYR